jgi:hypothetical protein
MSDIGANIEFNFCLYKLEITSEIPVEKQSFKQNEFLILIFYVPKPESPLKILKISIDCRPLERRDESAGNKFEKWSLPVIPETAGRFGRRILPM